MSATFAIKEDSAGLWRICRGQLDFASRLRLEQAIKQANQLSRDEQCATGENAVVEMHGPDFAITLTR
ncbi:hypothetical protein [Rhodanobacter sp. C03]|uniref:hypothetical protein n=1 Tax=Rhodanobacter sp. C03 TaxID=1945858 RepID=UPI0009862626|nr:hypothetical protein [Rhodanobacter sp. C03]OOG60062.1 hypothetical protein B0E48_04685 [Rhodanobacter sp. C03]